MPRSGWWPRRRKEGDPPWTFLPPLPRHTDTAKIARLTPEQLREHGLDPTRVRRRRKLFSRSIAAFFLHWRLLITATTILSLLASALVAGRIGFRDAFNDKDGLPALAAPSRRELDRSIELGKRYVEALYKPITEAAVQSEASGVPLRVYFATSKEWVLLGEEREVCFGNDCDFTTSLEPANTGLDDERYTVNFSSSTTRNALSVEVSVDWSFGPNQFEVLLSPKTVKEQVDVWLDTEKLATFSPANHQQASRRFASDRQSLLRMLRFTIRHATQEAYMYWSTYGNDPKKADALSRFLERNNYTPGRDMRAPLFQQHDNPRARLFDMSGLPDDLPFNTSVYPDCEYTARPEELAYAYKSKICGSLLGLLSIQSLYVSIGARDPFIQGWQALTTLMKYNDPHHKVAHAGSWLQGETPAEIAKHLQGQWNRTGFGIPKCTPFSCQEMSSIRTSVFGALQTQLGYHYGNEASRRFADAAAKMIVTAQVGADGNIRMKDKTYYRPAQVGAYLAAWDTADARFIVPSTPKLAAGIALLLAGEEPIPPEYLGVVASNSETSLDALGFLLMYRCAAHKVC